MIFTLKSPAGYLVVFHFALLRQGWEGIQRDGKPNMGSTGSTLPGRVCRLGVGKRPPLRLLFLRRELRLLPAVLPSYYGHLALTESFRGWVIPWMCGGSRGTVRDVSGGVPSRQQYAIGGRYEQRGSPGGDASGGRRGRCCAACRRRDNLTCSGRGHAAAYQDTCGCVTRQGGAPVA